jgi:hypothetical protein
MTTREPLAMRTFIVAAIAAVVNLAVAFGWDLSVEQVGAINAAVLAVSAAIVVVWTRGAVTPVDDPRDADGQPLTAAPDDY